MGRAARRSGLVLAALSGLVLTVVGGAAGSEPVPRTEARAPVPVLDWQPCGDGLEEFLCATVEVPRDYDRPHGRTTTLALTKLPAAGRAAERMGTLFTNPGGPGGSGVDFVQQTAPYVYDAEVLARYDVVGFDPRGVARSDPATCFRSADEEASSSLLSGQPYPLDDAKQEARHIADWGRLSLRCQLTSPQRFAIASTANVARDMDLLRQAVGDERLTYAGYSYGTYLGATYARLFPHRVGRFVLDATVDPVAWSGTGTGIAAPSTPFGIRSRQGTGADETFGEFARLCREAGSDRCALAALGDPAEVVPTTLDRLAAHPIEIPLPDGSTIEITQQVVVAVIFQSLYSPMVWPELAALLAEIAVPVPAGEDVAAAAVRTRSALGSRLRGDDYPSIGGALASLCVDAAHSGRVHHYPRLVDAADRQAPYFGRFRGWVGLPCEFWRITDEDRFAGPWQQLTRSPVLVVGTRFDPATPYRQARPYADLFPRGRLLTLDGWGHAALGKSVCVDDAVAGYLLTGRPPADGTTCRPDAEPFATAPGARQAPRPDVPAGLPLW